MNNYFNAGLVLKQLGGNRFMAMTGAKNFVKDDEKSTISFKIGRNSLNCNYVRITLNVWDTYDMEFLSIRGAKLTIKSTANGIYNDQLQEVFTDRTGLATRF